LAAGRIAIAQLSDIHLKAENRVILNKIGALDAAIRSEASDCELLIVLLTGDIAFSGSAAEYELADTFVRLLLISLRKWAQRVEVVIIPGNHDCDFRSESRLRPIVLGQIDTLLDEVQDDKHEAAQHCLSVQQAFFTFVGPYMEGSSGDQLHQKMRYQAGGVELRIECLNTAWLSRKNEEQGQIRVSHKVAARIGESGGEDAGDSFVITILHHPYGWFDPTNRRRIQSEIEKHSDLIMTGHEHAADHYQRKKTDITEVQYVEGAVLQGDGVSSFNLVRLDFPARQQEVLQFSFHGTSYNVTHKGGARAMIRNGGTYSRRFQSNDQFNNDLSAPGRGFKHPRRRDLRLRDLFLYPDLRQRMFDKRLRGDTSAPSTIYGENVVDHFIKIKKALIIGPHESGKTSIARALYSDFQVIHHLTPILIEGNEMRGYTRDALRDAVDRAVARQYSDSVVNEYSQLPVEKKVLILDNFQAFEYNAKAQARLIKEAEGVFGIIVVFADDLFRYEELSEESREVGAFVDFDHCEVRPLGFRLRRQMIQRWVWLGQEYQITEPEAFQEVERRERVVDTILRGELIPAYPLIVLLILQAGEVNPDQAVNSGTYGYLNDSLITRALANVSRQITDIGTMSTYLGHLAYAQFRIDAEEISRAEFDRITTEYVEEYGLTLNADTLLNDLTGAQLLIARGGSVEFRYRHYYFYFVARFFRDNIEGRKDSALRARLQAELREIADNIYFEPYVSILTFYLYFKKDEELIEYLLQNSKQIYAGYEPCNLASHVEFLNKLYEKKPRLTLPDPAPEKRRDELLRTLDAENGPEPNFYPRPAKVRYSEELQDYLKINIALKTMQVLGQVLKDSPGQLPAKLKSDLAEECYSIGLRALRAVFQISEVNLAEFQEAIEELIKDRRGGEASAKTPKDANQFLLWLCLGAALGVIRRTSRAVGHNQLERTYQDVLGRLGNSVSAELIDLTIKIDHFHEIKRSTVERLVHDKLRDNIFGYQIVQDLVYNYFALFPSEREDRQRICATVGITSEDPRFLDSRLKKLGPSARSSGSGKKRRSKKRR